MITVRRAGTLSREFFGTIDPNTRVEAITLANPSGAQVQVLTYAAAIRSIRVPDRAGVLEDIVLGYDTLQEYRADRWYLGSVIGRFANRIAGGRFVLDGNTHALALNDGPNHLHGGPLGFHTRMWHAEPIPSQSGVSVRLSRLSPDGEEGYPGTLNVAVVYTWTPANELIVDYRATCDRATPINLTQHAYFNLRGAGRGDVRDHELQIFANQYLPVDDTLIPQTREAAVAGTPFDFRAARRILTTYDHCYALRDPSRDITRAACLYDAHSGRTLEVFTTEPGLQLYTGQFLSVRGKGGSEYGPCSGLCLETQHFPDSPNRPDFPNVILRPGEQFRSTTIFRFDTRSAAQP